MLNFHIVTLFPEFFASPLSAGLMGKAVEKGLIGFSFHNPRDFSKDKHRHVDDRPFGGGPGMIMRLDPVISALRSIKNSGRLLLTSPQGRQFDHAMARSIVDYEDITIICGRYEGIDSRLKDFFPLEEISLCPAVFNGGEIAALAIIEAAARFVAGFLGKEESALEESYAAGLLEFPQYTRPENYGDIKVPDVLLNGNHKAIEEWRKTQSLMLTLRKRPELLENAPLSRKDVGILREIPRERPGRNLSFCLCHFPVKLEEGKTGVSSFTNIDIHDIARISCGFGMGPFFVLTPLRDQRELLRKILKHWLHEVAGREHEDRKKALGLVRIVADFEELRSEAKKFYGQEPAYIATSASWPEGKNQILTFQDAFNICAMKPAIICLGTARGLDLRAMPVICQRLRPLRFLDENHFSVRSAAAILADRILGDFY